jgi:hypothetical protein
MMKKLMHILFLSCIKATELIEKRFHFKLTLRERLKLRVHKMMCDACTNYEKQSFLLEKGIELHHHQLSKDRDVEILKKKIILNLNESKN